MADSNQPSQVHHGTVKLILSGDTVVVRGVPKGGPPPEKVISFSGVAAPRLARRPAAGSTEPAEQDEAYAWESREFLRNKLIGQSVTFTVDYTVPNGRDYGTLFLGSGPSAENITQTMISKGLVSLKDGARQDDPSVLPLVALEQHAKGLGLGVHAPTEVKAKTIRTVKYHIADPAAFVEKLAYKPVDAIIEHVRDGSNFRAILIPSMQSISCSLTGIRTPTFRRDPTTKTEVAEPYAAEAKYFFETRILQRQIKLVVEGTSGQQGFLCSIKHPKGNVSQLLVAEGFAKIMDYSFADVREDRDKLRTAEAAAKQCKLRIWKDYEAPVLDIPADQRTFMGLVLEVSSPERLVVQKPDGTRTEITISSVRQPRRVKTSDDKRDKGGDDNAGGRRKKPLFDVPFMFQAREFLRKKLVGNHAQFVIDYVRPAEGNYPAKVCATVTIGDTDVAEALVTKGLGTVFRHDELRSLTYDRLMQAERNAQKNKVGVHNGDGQPMRVSEITNKQAAEQILPALQRSGTIEAVVEFVSSGSRLRVYIPKHTCTCTFMLAGVSCPRTGYGDNKSEEFADEAMQFTKDLCLQRDVQLEVIDSDKNGNLVGNVFVGNTNVSVALLEQGLGSMHFTASRYGNEAMLAPAEESAKAQRLHVWSTYDPAAEAAKAAAAGGDGGETATAGTTEEVLVTEVVDAITFYAQRTSGAVKLGELMEALNKAVGAAPEAVDGLRKGTIVAAKFVDDAWYRARVESTDRDTGKITIRYVDYGNTEETDKSKLAVLPEACNFEQLPAQASQMQLALLAPPPEDYADEASELLRGGILNKVYKCSVESTEGDAQQVTLVHAESEDEVSKTMLAMGYATAVARTRDRRLQKLLTEYKACQDEAKTNHVGMWMYGDITEDPKDL